VVRTREPTKIERMSRDALEGRSANCSLAVGVDATSVRDYVLRLIADL
jgi:hypothetical protein